MAEFYAPQIQQPDILGSYIKGQMAGEQRQMFPYQLQQAQQGVQEGGLKIDQLRMAMNWQRSVQQYAQQRMGQDLQGAQGGAQQAGANPGGGVQSGPQAGVSAPQQASGSYNGSNGPLESTGLLDPKRLRITADVASYSALGKMEDANKPYADMLGIQAAARKDMQERAKIALAPRADQVNALLTSGNPEQLVLANSGYKQAWDQYAPRIGVKNPNDPKAMTPANVRAAATMFFNEQIAGQSMGAIEPKPMPDQLETVTENGYKYNRDPITGKASDIPGQTTPAEREKLSIEEQRLAMQKRISEGFSGKGGELLAALAEKGVSLPAGMRSKEQQLATVTGLLDRHPDMSPDQIADAVRTGKIDLAGQMKETTVAGGIAGKVKYAENELQQSIPLALAASKNVPRGSFMPLNRLLQTANTQINDPDLLDLKIKTQSVLNAYDMLAARGGTDVGKRAAQHAQLESAQSPEAYERALKAFTQEAVVAHNAADASMRAPGAASAGQHPPGIQSLLDKYK